MKGIVLSGGTGTRLGPISKSVIKQLLPIYDKPMIYYPISTLMLSGVREILLITTPKEVERFKFLLGDGSAWGISISYLTQDSPRGIGDAFILGEKFIESENVALALGDNILHGPGLGSQLEQNGKIVGAKIFGYEVSNPKSYGVVTLDNSGKPISIVEKPDITSSKLAVPGLYFYDSSVVGIAKDTKPSSRNEIEITSINQIYLNKNQLEVCVLPRGTAWLDAGTPESLHDAATYVRLIEQRQGLEVSCPEEIAWRKSWISDAQLNKLAESYPNSDYSDYLHSLTLL